MSAPFPISGDAYTIAAPLVSAKAKEKSVYNMTFRRSPMEAFSFAVNNKILLYGLSDYIEENLTTGISQYVLHECSIFMQESHAFSKSHRQHLGFDANTWNKVTHRYNGKLPIIIQALPEGSSFFPGQPIIQVRSLESGFGEMAAIIEAIMVGQVSIASTALTARRHLLAQMENYVREDDPSLNNADVRVKAQMMIHDFGMRSHSNKYESEMLGRAHLLVFPGTDTFNAAYSAFKKSDKGTIFGTSIPALAHRTVQSYENQIDAFRAIAEQATYMGKHTGLSIASMVADCYDFDWTIAHDYDQVCNEYPELIAVARPDSGDYVDNVMRIVTSAKDKGFYTTQPNGRIAMTTRRFIQGDAMTWEKMKNVMDTLKNNGFSPVNCGIFGVGGWLRNIATRDTLSAAYKLAAIGKDYTPVVKLSETLAKRSIPGPTQVLDGSPSVAFEWERLNLDNRLTVVYHGDYGGPSTSYLNESFDITKARALEQFDSLQEPSEFVSPAIRTVQDEYLKKWNKT